MISRGALSEVVEKDTQLLLNWDKNREKVLNIVSVPYNSSVVFLEIILKYVLQKRKVLFITNEVDGNIGLLEIIKTCTNFRDYTYFRKKNHIKNLNATLYITNHENALNLGMEFELVVYDDVCSISSYRKYEILDLLATYYREETKIICRSIEPVFRNSSAIDMPVRDYKLPMTEPRIITTRIDINKEIPYVIYEYLNFSVICERKVIIYVPDDKRGENVYNYLSIFRDSLHNNIIIYNRTTKKNMVNFLKNKRGILIMNYNDHINSYMKDTDIMVYFSDDKFYDYKKLVYMCGKVGIRPGLNAGEVIFLANEITRDMEIARDIIRNFNKSAWELGLLKI
jgi:late competence protein required for DNA uptake (superfamily II DNA/RNA helicase)